jgi:hypothetical protein
MTSNQHTVLWFWTAFSLCSVILIHSQTVISSVLLKLLKFLHSLCLNYAYFVDLYWKLLISITPDLFSMAPHCSTLNSNKLLQSATSTSSLQFSFIFSRFLNYVLFGSHVISTSVFKLLTKCEGGRIKLNLMFYCSYWTKMHFHLNLAFEYLSLCEMVIFWTRQAWRWHKNNNFIFFFSSYPPPSVPPSYSVCSSSPLILSSSSSFPPLSVSCPTSLLCEGCLTGYTVRKLSLRIFCSFVVKRG